MGKAVGEQGTSHPETRVRKRATRRKFGPDSVEVLATWTMFAPSGGGYFEATKISSIDGCLSSLK
jgi:hypothetical protein